MRNRTARCVVASLMTRADVAAIGRSGAGLWQCWSEPLSTKALLLLLLVTGTCSALTVLWVEVYIDFQNPERSAAPAFSELSGERDV
jgi:hypothetical protein